MANSQLFILILQWSAITRHIKRPSNILLHENKNTRKAKNRHYHGAGPAGLTAGIELLRQTDIIPILLEEKDCVGGLSRTVFYHGNRMDIGGHRFFSKDPDIMKWWTTLLPLQGSPAQDDLLTPCMKTFSPEDRPRRKKTVPCYCAAGFHVFSI